MTKLLIANTCYESEIENEKAHPLEQMLCSHTIFMQLQYLSFLYGDEDDIALCSHHPEPEYLQRLSSLGIKREYALLSQSPLPKKEIDCWGQTPSVALWAKGKGIPFSMPSWALIREVNSKIFSFSNAPPLTKAMLIRDMDEAERWARSFAGKKVLKSAYGLSGRGNKIVEDHLDDKTRGFLKQQFDRGLAVIAEPWVERLFDFSTQWIIDKEKQIHYLGATICHNDAKGAYVQTEILPSHDIGSTYDRHLVAHKEEALSTLQLMASMGYFGNVGIDAMIYGDMSSAKLHPIVEINARKTMGWLALAMQKKHFAHKTLVSSYSSDKTKTNFLPYYALVKDGKKIPFTKQLCFFEK